MCIASLYIFTSYSVCYIFNEFKLIRDRKPDFKMKAFTVKETLRHLCLQALSPAEQGDRSLQVSFALHWHRHQSRCPLVWDHDVPKAKQHTINNLKVRMSRNFFFFTSKEG